MRGRILLVGVMALSAFGGWTGCSSWFLREETGSLQEATLEELVSRLDQRTGGLTSLKALMTVRVSGGQPVTARLTWVRPQQLHVQGFDLVGGTLFDLVVTGGNVQWSAPGRPPVFLGTVESLARSEPSAPGEEGGRLPFAIEDLLRVTEALIGPAFKKGELPVLERPPGPFYILHSVTVEQGTARLTKRFWMDGRRLRLARQEFFKPDGSPEMGLEFSDYRPTHQGDWPHRLVAQRLGADKGIELVFREVRFNIPVALEEFRLTTGAVP